MKCGTLLAKETDHMTGINSLNKMFRWLKDKKKNKHEGGKPRGVEDDYGFRKKQKQIILQETENGHSVIIKDDETTLVYPQSFCRLNYRARMPTPVQNFKETSTHIYDEIPEMAVRTRLRFETNKNEADIVKDTHSSRSYPMDFKNAIEVGPYLIVPIVNSSDSSKDVEIFKRNENDEFSDGVNSSPKTPECHCESEILCTCNNKASYNPPWDSNTVPKTDNVKKDTKVVLTRCVKSKFGVSFDNIKPMCSLPDLRESNSGPFQAGASSPDTDSPTLTEISDSRTLTETPDISSEHLDTCAIESEKEIDKACSESERKPVDGSDTCCEYDLSTSGESDKSATSDYELYLSKIENNLKLKHDVRKMADNIGYTIPENETGSALGEELDTMTYVSSLSEYSSAASHISDISADRSASDDSSGYYECSEEVTESRDHKQDSRVSLERSVSAPESGITNIKTKKTKDKVYTKSKKSTSSRSHSFDHKANKLTTADGKEIYKFPSIKKSNSSSSSGTRSGKGKSVLAPQPTPVYMDPYRGKSRSHNRLLGDLIRMNYDKQLFTH